jgi:hypothetical protein
MRDGLAEHWRESYVCETGKSMKAADMALAHADGWRYIPISPIESGRVLPRCLRAVNEISH